MAWIYLSSVSVNSGSRIVNVDSSMLDSIEPGWSLDIGSTRSEIQRVAPGESGAVITLEKPWQGASVSNAPAMIVPIAGGELYVIEQLQAANSYAVQTHAAMRDFMTLDADITLTPLGGEPMTFSTLPKLTRLLTGEQAATLNDISNAQQEVVDAQNAALFQINAALQGLDTARLESELLLQSTISAGIDEAVSDIQSAQSVSETEYQMFVQSEVASAVQSVQATNATTESNLQSYVQQELTSALSDVESSKTDTIASLQSEIDQRISAAESDLDTSAQTMINHRLTTAESSLDAAQQQLEAELQSLIGQGLQDVSSTLTNQQSNAESSLQSFVQQELASSVSTLQASNAELESSMQNYVQQEIDETNSALTQAQQNIASKDQELNDIRNDIADVESSILSGEALTIIIRDSLRDSVEKSSGGRNTVIYDDQGNPNVMVVIPRFNYEDLGLDSMNLGTGTVTAFMTNGVPRSEILISKYIASQAGSGCASVENAEPLRWKKFLEARSLCRAKGAGWHLMSWHEWQAIKLWCLANGTMPDGNTYNGRSYDYPHRAGRRLDGRAPGDLSGKGTTLTGSGPDHWSHDHTAFGIFDLVGNVSEFVDQFKLEVGVPSYTLDNDPNAAESSWITSDMQFGKYGSQLSLESISNAGSYSGSTLLESHTDLILESSYVSTEEWRRLGIEPPLQNIGSLLVSFSDYSAQYASLGAPVGARSGIGQMDLSNSIASSGSTLGFRASFFP